SCPRAGAIEGELEAGTRTAAAQGRKSPPARRNRSQSPLWMCMVPPFSHRLPPWSGASPEVAPDYWSRRGGSRFKLAGRWLAAAGSLTLSLPSFGPVGPAQVYRAGRTGSATEVHRRNRGDGPVRGPVQGLRQCKVVGVFDAKVIALNSSYGTPGPTYRCTHASYAFGAASSG